MKKIVEEETVQRIWKIVKVILDLLKGPIIV